MPHSSLNRIKGRVAETLIQELFLAHGYNVFHYGMERSIPGIEQLTRKTFGAVKEKIRSMPDFVVQNPDTQKKILQHLFYHNQATIGELADIAGIHEKSIRLYLNHFIDHDHILDRLSAKKRDKNAKYAFKKL